MCRLHQCEIPPWFLPRISTKSLKRRGFFRAFFLAIKTDYDGIYCTLMNNRPLQFFGACICASYLLPYHVHPFRAFYNDWLVIFGLAVLVAFQAERGVSQLRMPWVAGIPLGLMVVIVVQTTLGMLTVSWDAVLPIAYLGFAALACALGATLSASENGAYGLCKTIAIAHVIAGLVSVGIASVQFLATENYFGSFVMPISHASSAIRPFANVAQPNQLALLFCIAIAGVWWLLQDRQIRGFIAFVTVLLLIWGLALTQSRVGWLIVPAFVIAAWVWGGRVGVKVSRLAIAALVSIYSSLILALPYLSSAVGVKTASLAERIGGQSERLILLKQAFHTSFMHPLFGAGWYEFGSKQVDIGADFLPSAYSQHAHNLILNLAAEVGWPVTITVFGTFVYWIANVWLRANKINKEICFAAMFFVAVLIHSLVEFPLWYGYVLLPFSLLIGVVHQEQLNSRSVYMPRIGWGLLAGLISIGLVVVAVDYRRVVVGFRVLGMHSLGLASDDGTMNKPGYTLFPHFFDYFSFAKTPASKGMRKGEILEMEQISRRFGYAPVLMRMSLVYALNNRPEGAYRSLMTIKGLHPSSYEEAYSAWKLMALSDPVVYLPVFKRLPMPQSDTLDSKSEN